MANKIKKGNAKSKVELNRQFLLGYELAFKKEKRKIPWKNIFLLWFEAANKGHLRAQFYIGTCYDNGFGVKKNVLEAFNWYLKAASNGKMEAQYNIGFFYKNGELVKQNFKKAVHWYKLAARQGDTEAQRDLGYCYVYGQGVKKIFLRQFIGIEKLHQKTTLKLYII